MITINGISQIAVPVNNLETAQDFYCNKLGFEHLFSVEQMCFVACGDVRLMLSLPNPEEMKNHSNVIYFDTENISETATGLKTAGVNFLQDPECIGKLPDQELWMAFFRDPFGNILALEERKMLHHE